jgi:hypothetical protein
MTVLLQDIPSSDLANQGDEDVWEAVGVMIGRDTSPPLAAEDAVPEVAQQETYAVEPQALVEEIRNPPPATAVAVEQPEERVEECLVEAGAAGEADIMDVASIPGALTVTVVWSTL